MAGESAFSIFRRLIEQTPATLSPGAAEAILGLRFAEVDQARIDELAARSSIGALTPVEADEYDSYVAAADVLSLWKSKARVSIKTSAKV